MATLFGAVYVPLAAYPFVLGATIPEVFSGICCLLRADASPGTALEEANNAFLALTKQMKADDEAFMKLKNQIEERHNPKIAVDENDDCSPTTFALAYELLAAAEALLDFPQFKTFEVSIGNFKEALDDLSADWRNKLEASDDKNAQYGYYEDGRTSFLGYAR